MLRPADVAAAENRPTTWISPPWSVGGSLLDPGRSCLSHDRTCWIACPPRSYGGWREGGVFRITRMGAWRGEPQAEKRAKERARRPWRGGRGHFFPPGTTSFLSNKRDGTMEARILEAERVGGGSGRMQASATDPPAHRLRENRIRRPWRLSCDGELEAKVERESGQRGRRMIGR